jgi:hypothetical protein
MRRFLPTLLAAVVLGLPVQALAWGSTGHRLIGQLAIDALPVELPAFLRASRADVGELAREPDRWRGAGQPHDELRDPLHYMYADDNGQLPGGATFMTLPPTRAAFAEQVRKAGADPDAVGYLAYAIADGYQQLVKDFAFWRAEAAGEKLAKDAKKRDWLAADRLRRERQIVQDIGVWAHYVGDATQPMHVSVHHDGWGDYSNPDGFTTQKVHVPWEGAYVAAQVSRALVRIAMSDPQQCSYPTPLACAGAYLEKSRAQLRPFYELEMAGAFKPGETRGSRFAGIRLAEAAAELRDLITKAWRESATAAVNNYPPVPVGDIEAGRADAYDVLHGVD